MTQQEEIREVIANALLECPIENVGCDGLAQHILNKLHSQGVVLKAERELPLIPYKQETSSGKKSMPYMIASSTQRNMLDAGYSATNPLIKEE